MMSSKYSVNEVRGLAYLAYNISVALDDDIRVNSECDYPVGGEQLVVAICISTEITSSSEQNVASVAKAH